MEYIETKLMLPKETKELADAIEAVLQATIDAGKDGFQMGDIASILPVVISKFPTAVDGMDKIKLELAQDPKAFSDCASLLGSHILSVFLKKPEAPVVPQA